MMYEYITLDDNTTVAHSEMKADGTVTVYIEKPVDGGFNHVTCILPQYEWKDNEGYSTLELEALNEFVQNNAHLILEFSKEGGFSNASSF